MSRGQVPAGKGGKNKVPSFVPELVPASLSYERSIHRQLWQFDPLHLQEVKSIARVRMLRFLNYAVSFSNTLLSRNIYAPFIHTGLLLPPKRVEFLKQVYLNNIPNPIAPPPTTVIPDSTQQQQNSNNMMDMLLPPNSTDPFSIDPFAASSLSAPVLPAELSQFNDINSNNNNNTNGNDINQNQQNNPDGQQQNGNNNNNNGLPPPPEPEEFKWLQYPTFENLAYPTLPIEHRLVTPTIPQIIPPSPAQERELVKHLLFLLLSNQLILTSRNEAPQPQRGDDNVMLIAVQLIKRLFLHHNITTFPLRPMIATALFVAYKTINQFRPLKSVYIPFQLSFDNHYIKTNDTTLVETAMLYDGGDPLLGAQPTKGDNNNNNQNDGYSIFSLSSSDVSGNEKQIQIRPIYPLTKEKQIDGAKWNEHHIVYPKDSTMVNREDVNLARQTIIEQIPSKLPPLPTAHQLYSTPHFHPGRVMMEHYQDLLRTLELALIKGLNGGIQAYTPIPSMQSIILQFVNTFTFDPTSMILNSIQRNNNNNLQEQQQQQQWPCGQPQWNGQNGIKVGAKKELNNPFYTSTPFHQFVPPEFQLGLRRPGPSNNVTQQQQQQQNLNMYGIDGNFSQQQLNDLIQSEEVLNNQQDNPQAEAGWMILNNASRHINFVQYIPRATVIFYPNDLENFQKQHPLPNNIPLNNNDINNTPKDSIVGTSTQYGIPDDDVHAYYRKIRPAAKNIPLKLTGKRSEQPVDQIKQLYKNGTLEPNIPMNRQTAKIIVPDEFHIDYNDLNTVNNNNMPYNTPVGNNNYNNNNMSYNTPVGNNNYGNNNNMQYNTPMGNNNNNNSFNQQNNNNNNNNNNNTLNKKNPANINYEQLLTKYTPYITLTQEKYHPKLKFNEKDYEQPYSYYTDFIYDYLRKIYARGVAYAKVMYISTQDYMFTLTPYQISIVGLFCSAVRYFHNLYYKKMLGSPECNGDVTKLPKWLTKQFQPQFLLFVLQNLNSLYNQTKKQEFNLIKQKIQQQKNTNILQDFKEQELLISKGMHTSIIVPRGYPFFENKLLDVVLRHRYNLFHHSSVITPFNLQYIDEKLQWPAQILATKTISLYNNLKLQYKQLYKWCQNKEIINIIKQTYIQQAEEYQMQQALTNSSMYNSPQNNPNNTNSGQYGSVNNNNSSNNSSNNNNSSASSRQATVGNTFGVVQEDIKNNPFSTPRATRPPLWDIQFTPKRDVVYDDAKELLTHNGINSEVYKATDIHVVPDIEQDPALLAMADALAPSTKTTQKDSNSNVNIKIDSQTQKEGEDVLSELYYSITLQFLLYVFDLYKTHAYFNFATHRQDYHHVTHNDGNGNDNNDNDDEYTPNIDLMVKIINSYNSYDEVDENGNKTDINNTIITSPLQDPNVELLQQRVIEQVQNNPTAPKITSTGASIMTELSVSRDVLRKSAHQFYHQQLIDEDDYTAYEYILKHKHLLNTNHPLLSQQLPIINFNQEYLPQVTISVFTECMQHIKNYAPFATKYTPYTKLTHATNESQKKRQVELAKSNFTSAQVDFKTQLQQQQQLQQPQFDNLQQPPQQPLLGAIGFTATTMMNNIDDEDEKEKAKKKLIEDPNNPGNITLHDALVYEFTPTQAIFLYPFPTADDTYFSLFMKSLEERCWYIYRLRLILTQFARRQMERNAERVSNERKEYVKIIEAAKKKNDSISKQIQMKNKEKQLQQFGNSSAQNQGQSGARAATQFWRNKREQLAQQGQRPDYGQLVEVRDEDEKMLKDKAIYDRIPGHPNRPAALKTKPFTLRRAERRHHQRLRQHYIRKAIITAIVANTTSLKKPLVINENEHSDITLMTERQRQQYIQELLLEQNRNHSMVTNKDELTTDIKELFLPTFNFDQLVVQQYDRIKTAILQEQLSPAAKTQLTQLSILNQNDKMFVKNLKTNLKFILNTLGLDYKFQFAFKHRKKHTYIKNMKNKLVFAKLYEHYVSKRTVKRMKIAIKEFQKKKKLDSSYKNNVKQKEKYNKQLKNANEQLKLVKSKTLNKKQRIYYDVLYTFMMNNTTLFNLPEKRTTPYNNPLHHQHLGQTSEYNLNLLQQAHDNASIDLHILPCSLQQFQQKEYNFAQIHTRTKHFVKQLQQLKYKQAQQLKSSSSLSGGSTILDIKTSSSSDSDSESSTSELEIENEEEKLKQQQIDDELEKEKMKNVIVSATGELYLKEDGTTTSTSKTTDTKKNKALQRKFAGSSSGSSSSSSSSSDSDDDKKKKQKAKSSSSSISSKKDKKNKTAQQASNSTAAATAASTKSSKVKSSIYSDSEDEEVPINTAGPRYMLYQSDDEEEGGAASDDSNDALFGRGVVRGNNGDDITPLPNGTIPPRHQDQEAPIIPSFALDDDDDEGDEIVLFKK